MQIHQLGKQNVNDLLGHSQQDSSHVCIVPQVHWVLHMGMAANEQGLKLKQKQRHSPLHGLYQLINEVIK